MKKEFDLIFVYQLSPVTMAVPGIIYKKLSSKPLYLYSCDVWPESMKNIISNEENLIYKSVKKLSNYIYSKSDAITVTSKPFVEYFINEHSISLEKLNYIPQHAEEEYLTMDFIFENDVVDFVFMGNIGKIQDIECILDATDRIKAIPDFKVHFVGDGSFLQRSKEIVREKGLENLVFFHGSHPLKEMPRFYKLADACLLTLKDESIVGLTMPSKLQGYMAAGKPVIGAINGAAKEVIRESKCGVCVDASDSVGLANAMEEFIKEPEKFLDSGENGRKYFLENFTKERFMNSLEKDFYKLIGDWNV